MKLNIDFFNLINLILFDRLAEIEHQISSASATNAPCTAQIAFGSSNSSNASVEENERNKESII